MLSKNTSKQSIIMHERQCLTDAHWHCVKKNVSVRPNDQWLQFCIHDLNYIREHMGDGTFICFKVITEVLE